MSVAEGKLKTSTPPGDESDFIAAGQVKMSALASELKNDCSSSYFGGKGQDGVYQKLINQIPPHDIYVEAFFGGGSIMRRKRPALKNIGYELCEDAINRFRGLFGRADIRNECGFTGVIAYRDRANTFMFIDPPYLPSTRRSNARYNYELTESEHEKLLSLIVDAKCFVMIATYPNEMYEKALKGWRKMPYTSVDRAGNVRDELVYMNYPEPAYLHDYSYLGENKDQRQRIKRKVQTNAKKILGWDTKLRAKFLLEIAPSLTSEERELLECRRK